MDFRSSVPRALHLLGHTAAPTITIGSAAYTLLGPAMYLRLHGFAVVLVFTVAVDMGGHYTRYAVGVGEETELRRSGSNATDHIDGAVTVERCGWDTRYDPVEDVCICDTNVVCSSPNHDTEWLQPSNDTTKDPSHEPPSHEVYIVGILDTETFDWAPDVFNWTVAMLNNHSDGFHDDDVFSVSNGTTTTTTIVYDLINDDCNEGKAVRAYWTQRNNNSYGLPIHGIIGSRCSGPSMEIARIAGLEAVTQVSPVSISSELSNNIEYPYFSRLVAPSDARGAVGALIALVRSFGWTRVSMIVTDTEYAQQTLNEFTKLWSGDHYDNHGQLEWTGRLSYSNVVELLSNGDIDPVSVQTVLRGVPHRDVSVNSRVILLIAQEEHAFPILKIASDMNFQSDTIWIGLSWIARSIPISTEWVPEIPGYLGIGPYRNQDAVAMDFLRRVQSKQIAQGIVVPWTEIKHYAVEYLVDSILALTMALSRVATDQRRNGTAVTDQLRLLQFNGVSGPVSFTVDGDRADPKYTIYNYQRQSDRSLEWIEVGTVGTVASSAQLTNGIQGICFAMIGCNHSTAPSDTYPRPQLKAAIWVYMIIAILVLFVGVLISIYRRKSRHHESNLASMAILQHELDDALQQVHETLAQLDDQVDDATRKKEELILQRASLMDTPDTWTTETDEDQILVEVDSQCEEYWVITDQLQESMPNAHISKLWRIQNKYLWAYYSFHKHRFAMHDIPIHETHAWHGTSTLDPYVIYSDRQDGFMMQYAQPGFWGRGIYFAQKSLYSHEYAFRPGGQQHPRSTTTVSSSHDNDDGRSEGREDERELFLVSLLVGNSIEIDREATPEAHVACANLTAPPLLPLDDLTTTTTTVASQQQQQRLKYNTVCGYIDQTKVWVVYENGRAYPDYLIRYYVGPRDPHRTPPLV